MTLVRLSSTPTIEQVEHAYRTFLRKTWLGVPALIELCIGIIAKTRVFANPDGTPSQRNYLFYGVVAFYIVLFPLIVLALAFTRGCNELRTIAFGRLVWWQIFLYGVFLGAIGQFSGRVSFPLFGGAIVSANNDPNLIGAILNLILIVILTPITEEAIFRVVLQTYLQRYGTAIAIVGTVVAFIFFT